MTVLIDNRETPLTIHNGVQQFGLENIKVATLLTGDVLFNGVCVERKTSEDLINSKISPDKHLDTQCKRMTAYPIRVLVIEGSFKQLIKNNPHYSRYNLDWYHGVLASVQVNYGIMIKEVDNNKEFWKYVGKLHYKSERKKEIELSPIYTPKISKVNKSIPLSMICTIPNN